MRRVCIDPTMNQEILEQGYTHHQMLSEADTSYLLAEMKKTCPEMQFEPDGELPSHEHIYSSYMENDLSLREASERLVREVFTTHVDQILDRYRILSCGFFIKAPRGGELSVHAHWRATESWKDTVVNFWCPLMETDVTNGTFHAVPGTHKIFPETFYLNYYPYYQDYVKVVKEKYSVPLPSKPGQAVIFDDTMLHWSPDNLSDKPRYAMHCTCVPKEVRSTFFFFDEAQPDRFDVYETNEAFYVENALVQKRPRPTDLKFLKTLPNTNRLYPLAEFEERMKNGAELRRALADAPEPEPIPSEAPAAPISTPVPITTPTPIATAAPIATPTPEPVPAAPGKSGIRAWLKSLWG